MTALDTLIERLSRTSLVVGKGGVGKTTVAAALAGELAGRGERTLLVSTDPAAALGAVLDAALDESTHEIAPNLFARQLAAPTLRRDFLARWRDTIADIVDRGTYLDREDIDGLVDAALPGADEIFALLALGELAASRGTYDRVVVDTAPTGHTLRLLALPETFSALVSLLDTMQDKHRFMVRALTHRYRRDRADDLIDELRERVDALRTALRNPQAVAAIVVARAEPVVVAETRRFLEALTDAHIEVAAVIMNVLGGESAPDRQAALGPESASKRIPRFALPAAASTPTGLGALHELVRRLAPLTPARASDAPSARRAIRREQARDIVGTLARTLTIVGGKGGVGKSTAATALAIAMADAGLGPVLLVSTDPAPSIADALGMSEAPWARHDIEHELADVPSLAVRQMDAAAAFARLRDTYQTRIDGLFDALVARGIDAAHDRAIIRDLLALAPPGIDEMYGLSVLGDALHEGRFARVIVDPAPTGHLLRLLEMPVIALDWSHRLMRLMLKYRDVGGLGDTAQDLLEFARRTRALDALLRDAERASTLLVSLDEPVVRGETKRLLEAIRGVHIAVSGVLWNRTRSVPAPLPASPPVRQFVAEAETPSPIGVGPLRQFIAAWTALPLQS